MFEDFLCPSVSRSCINTNSQNITRRREAKGSPQTTPNGVGAATNNGGQDACVVIKSGKESIFNLSSTQKARTAVSVHSSYNLSHGGSGRNDLRDMCFVLSCLLLISFSEVHCSLPLPPRRLFPCHHFSSFRLFSQARCTSQHPIVQQPTPHVFCRSDTIFKFPPLGSLPFFVFPCPLPPILFILVVHLRVQSYGRRECDL